MAKTSIIFHNIKGGTGKTTLSIMAAEYFHLKGLKTVVLDLDYQQANACQYFATQEDLINKNTTLLDVLVFINNNMENLISKKDIDIQMRVRGMLSNAIIAKHINESSITFGCVASNLDLVEIENKFKNDLVRTKYLLDIVKKNLYSLFDVIIIDTPPNYDGLVQSAYFGFDNLIIVTDVGEFGFTGIGKSLNNYNMSKIENNKLNLIGIAINKYARNNYSEIFYDSLKNYYDEIVITEPIYNYTDFQESIMSRNFLLSKNYKCKNARAKENLKIFFAKVETKILWNKEDFF